MGVWMMDDTTNNYAGYNRKIWGWERFFLDKVYLGFPFFFGGVYTSKENPC